MYRKSLEKMVAEENNPAMDVQFLSRVSQLPLITASIAQLAAIYSQAKESNRLLKYTLDKAESGVVGVASTAAPLVNKFGKPITYLDGFACGQLDKLQDWYPIINKPADVWVSKGQDIYGNSVLKPSLDKIVTVKDAGVGTCAKVYDVTVRPSLATYSRAVNYASEKGTMACNAVYNVTLGPAVNLSVYTFSTAKNYTVGTAQAATQYSMDTMTNMMQYSMGKAGEAMGTEYGKILYSKVDGLVDKADQYVDYYLPEPEEDEKKIEMDSVEPESAMTKACVVTTKARRRMYQKAMTDIKNMKMRTQEAIDSLKHTVDLIQYDKVTEVISDAKTVAIDGAKFTGDKLKFYWEEMNKTGEEVENKEGETNQMDRMSMERRLIATARHLTQKIKYGVATLSATTSSLLPGSVWESVFNAKTYTQDLYNSFDSASVFSDLSHSALDQAKDKLEHLTQALSFATDYVLDTINVDWLKKWKTTRTPQENNVENAKEPEHSTTNGWDPSGNQNEANGTTRERQNVKAKESNVSQNGKSKEVQTTGNEDDDVEEIKKDL